MDKVNEQALLTASERAFRAAIIRKVNQLVDEIATGRVWENKVQAQRDINEVYNSLPISVVAEMIEEEVTAASQELGL